ncbi:MAG: hypothetical protein Q9180_002326 [Flavoplaca navasiana]
MIEENLRACVEVDFGLQKVIAYTQKLQRMQNGLRAVLVAQINRMDEEHVDGDDRSASNGSGSSSSSSSSSDSSCGSRVSRGCDTVADGDGDDGNDIRLEVDTETDESVTF